MSGCEPRVDNTVRFHPVLSLSNREEGVLATVIQHQSRLLEEFSLPTKEKHEVFSAEIEQGVTNGCVSDRFICCGQILSISELNYTAKYHKRKR